MPKKSPTLRSLHALSHLLHRCAQVGEKQGFWAAMDVVNPAASHVFPTLFDELSAQRPPDLPATALWPCRVRLKHLAPFTSEPASWCDLFAVFMSQEAPGFLYAEVSAEGKVLAIPVVYQPAQAPAVQAFQDFQAALAHRYARCLELEFVSARSPDPITVLFYIRE